MTRNIVLIPYRNRKKHLEYFLKHSAPKLKAELDNFELLVIEQSADNKLFNRGKLLNVGFDYCNDDEQEIYFWHHYVDHKPLKKILKIYNTKIKPNTIISIKEPHNRSLGTIIKFSAKEFKKINGFRNTFWGWGIEDRDLYHRAKFYNINIERKQCNKNNFKILGHKHNGNQMNKKKSFYTEKIFNSNNKEFKKKYINYSGLNNLKYKIIEEIEINEYCKKIIVEI